MSEPEAERVRGRGYLAAALGSFLGGVGSYVIMAFVGTADVTTRQFLTFDEKGELELEGLSIFVLLAISILLAAGGCWLALWKGDHPLAAPTGVVTLILLAPAVILATGTDLGPELAALATVVAALVARATVLGVRRMYSRSSSGEADVEGT